jgi:hypothetical protein
VSSDCVVFSAFGLNVRLDWDARLDLLTLPNFSQPDDGAQIDLDVHLLGATKRNGERVKLTSRVRGDKTIRFRSYDTATGRVQSFASEATRGRVEFVLSDGARKMWVSWSEEAPVAEVLSLLFNTMLAWAARFAGRICLHASVVALDGRAIAFVAPSGSGKSTIAASLIEGGYAGMSDDAAALCWHGGRFLVYPGLPQVGLRAGSLEALPRFRAENSVATDDKRRFTLLANDVTQHLRFQDRALPLRAIYFLRRSALYSDPEIVAAQPADSLAVLMGSLYPSSTRPSSRANAERQFSRLASVVQTVSCRHLTIPDTLSKLPSTVEKVSEDFVALDAA